MPLRGIRSMPGWLSGLPGKTVLLLPYDAPLHDTSRFICSTSIIFKYYARLKNSRLAEPGSLSETWIAGTRMVAAVAGRYGAYVIVDRIGPGVRSERSTSRPGSQPPPRHLPRTSAETAGRLQLARVT